MSERDNMNQSKEKHKNSKNVSMKKKIILLILLIIFIALVSYLGYLIYQNVRDKKLNADLQKDIESAKVMPEVNEVQLSEAEQQVVNKVNELQNENQDVKGWIQINDTKINYPLLQASEDNEYYLKRNYKKENSSYGSIFLDMSSDLNNNNSNLIIYGHNMKDGEMFQNLMYYTDKDFYDNHKVINIYTNNEARKYEIVTVFKSRVFYQNEQDVFRYYYSFDLDTEEKYNDYINNCKKIQLYDTGVNASFGEQLITLIVCEYSQTNGRFVVVAKRIS